MAPTWFKLLLVVLLIVVLFGRGKISDVMGDFGKGLKDFKKGLADDQTADAARPVEADASTRLEGPAERRVDARAV
jgi:sec-independent protein translocase protein TatA